MTRPEFAAVLGYISAAVGKSATEQQAEVYFDLLGDLPAEILRCAAQRALLEHVYATIPSVAVLRRLAIETASGGPALTAAEAWGVVRRAMVCFSYMRGQEAIASMPPLVGIAVDAIGWRQMCDSTDTERSFAQFRDAYQQLAQREELEKLLPAPLKQQLARIGHDARIAKEDERNSWQVLRDAGRDRSGKQIAGRIGVMPEEGKA